MAAIDKIQIGDKINIPKAGIYEVIGIFKRPNFDHRIWLMSTSPSDAGIWDEVVLCSSGGQLWGKIMGLDIGSQHNPNPVPKSMTLAPQQVWCFVDAQVLID